MDKFTNQFSDAASGNLGRAKGHGPKHTRPSWMQWNEANNQQAVTSNTIVPGTDSVDGGITQEEKKTTSRGQLRQETATRATQTCCRAGISAAQMLYEAYGTRTQTKS